MEPVSENAKHVQREDAPSKTLTPRRVLFASLLVLGASLLTQSLFFSASDSCSPSADCFLELAERRCSRPETLPTQSDGSARSPATQRNSGLDDSGLLLALGRLKGVSRAPRRSLERERGLRAEVSLGAPNVEGGRDPALIRRVVRRHISQARFCYERALLGGQEIAGRLEAQFSISSEGEVQSVNAGTVTLRAPEVIDCVLDSIRSFLFPPSSHFGVAQVTVPFEFSFTPIADNEVSISPEKTSSFVGLESR